MQIVVWDIDEYNLSEVEGHGVTLAELDQVLGNPYTLMKNRNDGERYLVVGTTDGGRVLTIPASRVDGVIWRPATAWDSTPREKRNLP